MFKDQKEAVDLVKSLIPLVRDNTAVDVVVSPPFTSIAAVVGAVQGTNIAVAEIGRAHV